MFLIRAHSGRRRWISGVFLRRDEAESYFREIPEDLRRVQVIEEHPLNNYPVYLTEDEHGFRLFNAAGAEALLRSFERKDEDERCYTNIYEITENWRPKEPGIDYMGAISHTHIRNSDLDLVREHGFENLWESSTIVIVDTN